MRGIIAFTVIIIGDYLLHYSGKKKAWHDLRGLWVLLFTSIDALEIYMAN